MKTRIILMLLMCTSCLAFAQPMKFGNLVFTGQINLEGDWWKGSIGSDKGGGRSVPMFPIMATIEKGYISVTFDDSVSGVLITISKEGHTVYSLSCTPDVSKACVIPISDFSPGIYLLEFTNPDGGVVYGWFEVR